MAKKIETRKLSVPLIQVLIGYLETRPWNEANNLLVAMNRELNPPPAPKATPKKPAKPDES